MHKVYATLFAVVIASGAVTAQAASVDQAELAECKAQVSGFHGDDVEIDLVSQRRYREGTQMKLAVHQEDTRTGYSTTQLATCWLVGQNYQAQSSGNDNEPMVAKQDLTSSSAQDEILP